jgi:hypothetical protein
MHGLFDRLRIGREQTKPDPLESARARIGELTEALQGLVDLSDSSRVRDFAEVKRLLARARKVLSDPGYGGHDTSTGDLTPFAENGLKVGWHKLLQTAGHGLSRGPRSSELH